MALWFSFENLLLLVVGVTLEGFQNCSILFFQFFFFFFQGLFAF